MNSNWSYSPETSNLGQNRCFLSRVTLKFYRWPWKTIGYLFYATSSSVHHFKAIGKIKLKLQSGNAQFMSKLAIFVPCDLEIWRMTLKSNRAPLLCCFKLCASFHCHQWTLAGATVLKHPIWVKIDNFFCHVTWKFDRLPLKTIGHLFYTYLRLVRHFLAIGEFKLEFRVRKRPIWVKIDNFLSRVTLKFDQWPWKQ